MYPPFANTYLQQTGEKIRSENLCLFFFFFVILFLLCFVNLVVIVALFSLNLGFTAERMSKTGMHCTARSILTSLFSNNCYILKHYGKTLFINYCTKRY